jgi:hypothetical protein
MSAEGPRLMFVDYFSPFAPWCDTPVDDNGDCLSTVGCDGSECSVGENTVLSETGDASGTGSSDVLTLDSGSSGDKSVTWSDFVVSVDSNGYVEYERMSSEGGTAEGSVGVSESKIPVELENRKAWQRSGEPWDDDFYLYCRTFPGTWGAGMQWSLWYARNMGCGGCQECKNVCRFYWRFCNEKGWDCLIWDTTAF